VCDKYSFINNTLIYVILKKINKKHRNFINFVSYVKVGTSMDKKWVLKEKAAEEKVLRLMKELNVEATIAELLIQRGIETYDAARVFFRPELSDLHDPFLMKDMDKAVERLNEAIKKNEKILIYGDYDVDGTTAVALVYSYLRKYHNRIGYYVPDRYSEGYGVSIQGIDHAAEENYNLIITLDCGIKATEKARYAQGKGIDVIICDHHNPGEELPCAVAVLDPKRSDCPYPYKELSGCGVGFKFMQAYIIHNGLNIQELYSFLDLVVVSIGSDIVPITGENRVLAYYGLQKLNSDPCKGLKSIINISGEFNKHIQIHDIVFKLGPRINAAGRMESGSMAVDLLVAELDHFADKIGNDINNFNTNRKELDQKITEEALRMIASDPDSERKKTTVVFSKDWHKGVIGIVASRLTETYYRPTIVMTLSNGMITGSARSVTGYNLYSAVESCSDLLENFGGHMYAAGLSLKPENFEEFRDRFENYVATTIKADQLIPTIEIDAELKIKDITPKFYRILNQFAPFGPNNMMPLFLSTHVYDNGSLKKVGKQEEHLKVKVVQELGANLCIEGIGFSLGEKYSDVFDFKPFDVCYHIFENHFMGQTFLQLMIKDIRKHE